MMCRWMRALGIALVSFVVALLAGSSFAAEKMLGSTPVAEEGEIPIEVQGDAPSTSVHSKEGPRDEQCFVGYDAEAAVPLGDLENCLQECDYTKGRDDESCARKRDASKRAQCFSEAMAAWSRCRMKCARDNEGCK